MLADLASIDVAVAVPNGTAAGSFGTDFLGTDSHGTASIGIGSVGTDSFGTDLCGTASFGIGFFGGTVAEGSFTFGLSGTES